MSALTPLRFGTLPTQSFLSLRVGNASEARAVLESMRRELARHGPTETLRHVLAAYGFVWGPAEHDMAMDDDVEAVRAALRSES